MIYERLRVFVSSTMSELAPERTAIKAALSELNIDAWVFEEDAGARPHSGQQAYKQQIDNSDIYVGLFWREYGEYTIDEFSYATERGKDRLIYEKRADVEGKRDPQLQKFMDDASNVETGVAVRWFDTCEELSAGIKDDAARWQTRKIRELRELNLSYQPSPFEAGEQRTLAILLRKVKHFWIEGVLQSTIRRAGLLELGKDTQPEAVGSPWEAVLELPFEGSQPVSSGKNIADVFDDIEHSMLILGQPGAGKTTTLLTLAGALADRVDKNPVQPVPVVFHLSSWADPKQPFDEWLVEELQDKYEIPTTTGRSCLEHQRLLLLLDGLDEVAREHQESCVESINRFAKEFGFPGIAVCCRLQQYGDLNVKLSLNGAICLRPLSDAQIDSYVKDAGADLAGLRTAIQQDESIRELARSPLMLNLMCITYRGYEPESLASREKPEDRSNHLFTTYIDKMFAKRGTSELTYSREKTLGWLSWIARRLYERSQAMFLIEGLQPSCLCGRRQRWAYLALFSVTLGVLMGFASIAHRGAGTFNEVVDSQNFAFLRPREWIMWLTVTPAWVLAYSWIENLGIRSGKLFLERAPAGMWRAAVKCVVSASIWLIVAWSAATLVLLDGNLTWDVLPAPFYWSGVALSIVLGALGRNRSVSYSIRTIETFRWSIKDAQRGALLGFIFGAIIGTPILVFEELRQKMPDASSWWIPILGFAIVGLGTGAMFGGLKPHVNDSKTTPNQGIRLSSRSSVLMALNAIWLVAIAAFIANAGGYVYTPNPAWTLNGMGVPMLGNFVGLFTVLILWFGGLDVVKHYVLRAVLSMSGNTPWNLARFLDQVQDLNLMQSAGNAYIFVHRRLRDFLATGSRVNTPE